MADQNDIEVRFGADTSELDGASKQAAQSVQSVSDTMKTATTNVTSYSNSLTAAQRYTQQATAGHQQMARAAQDSAQAAQDLASKYGAAGTQAAEFGRGLRALNDQLANGSISAAEHAAQLSALRSSVFGAGQATEQAAKSVFNLGLSTSQAVNGVRALGDELASGRIRQADGTFLRLFTHIASANPTMAALSAAVIVVGGSFASAVVHAEELERAVIRIQDAFYATGRAGDYTDQQIESFITELERLPGVSKEASEQTIAAISRIPDLSRPAFESVLAHAADLAAALGIKLPAAANLLAEAWEDPIRGADKLDKQLNFLTATQRLAIETTVEHGDKMKAFQMIVEALQPRIQGLANEGTNLQKSENAVKNAWIDLSGALGHSEHITALRNEVSRLTEAFAGLLKAMQSVSNWQPHIAHLGGDSNSQAPYKGGAKHSSPNPFVRYVNVGNSAASGADKQAERNRMANEGLALAEKYGAKASERLKLEREINQMLADRKAAEGQPEVQAKIDAGIAGAREKLARLNKPKKASHKGEATEMDQWRSQALAIKDNGSGQENYQAQIDFWRSKLPEAAKQGSKAVLEVQNEMHRLSIEQARESAREAKKAADDEYKAKIASLRTQQAAAKGNYDEQLKLEDQILAEVTKRYKQNSQQYQAELQKRIKMVQEHAVEQARFEIEADNRKIKLLEASIQAEQIAAQEKVKLHQMTEQQLTQLEIDEEKRRHDTVKDLRDKEERDFAKLPQQHQQVLNQLAQNEAQNVIKIAQLHAKLAEDMQKPWDTYAKAIENSMNSSINSMIRGQQSFKQAVLNVGDSILSTFIAQETHKLIFHEGAEAAKTAATVAGATTRTTVEAAAATESTALQAAESVKVIMMKAWEAAASVYASIAAIPVVGPFLAPAMAVGAAYEIGHYVSNINSAAGGWEVPYDQVMQVHENEVILPAKWSQRLATLADSQTTANAGGPSGGSGHTFNIHYAPSVNSRPDLKQHANELVDIMKKAARDGKF